MQGVVNNESTRPLGLEERARRVLAMLGIDTTDERMLRRASLFLNTNGYDVVCAAARYTRRRQREGAAIARPWDYTVATVNKNAARCGYLYLLFQWIEMGLRASLDQALSAAHGPDWHLKPVYLDPVVIQGLPYDPEQSSVKWRFPSGGDPVPDYRSPEEFLSRVTYGLLARMVIYGSGREPDASARRLAPILWAPDGSRLPPDAVESYLKRISRRIRGPVAHNRPPRYSRRGHLYLEHESYEGAVAHLEKVLGALRFDLAKALGRVVRAQVEVANEGIVRHGGADLRKLVALGDSR